MTDSDTSGFSFPTSRIPYADRRGLEAFPNGARMALLIGESADKIAAKPRVAKGSWPRPTRTCS